MSFSLKFENTKFIIISKFPEVDFHGENGIVDCLRREFPEALGVHRLDKATSGIMVFAKSRDVQIKLSKNFELREVKKTYVAISDKKPAKKQGVVKGDLEKARGGSYKLTRSLVNPSYTKFKSFYNNDLGLRGFFLYPKTGKTHQLRVVLKSLGSSILGDKRYGGTCSDRMYLHAYSLEFSLDGERFEFFDYPVHGEKFLKMKQDFIEGPGH